MGAPVVAFCRIDDKPIKLREPILEPDALIVQDPTLFGAIDVFAGLSNDGYLLINSKRSIEELGIADAIHLPDEKVRLVPATEIALKHIKRPLPNAVLLGALAATTGVIKIDSVVEAIASKFPGKVGELNIQAAEAAYKLLNHNNQEELTC